ncbi:hypothetical protein M569_14690 [Genlisea aurea]|uniref:DYW domain-containing protein n=1 Tax=Genlisea aurea TaxID=192259 RepID=S8C0D0_9LAMI|nr:hypothetical protein M569_14690 [Genlisea aurea]
MRILRQIHAHIVAYPHSSPPSRSFLLSKILCFAAYRNIRYARTLLTQIAYPSVFSYNTVIRGLILEGQSRGPIFLFRKLVRNKFPLANTFTLAFVLKSCAIASAFEEGRQVHKHVIASGFGGNLHVQTSLLNFYTKRENTEMARKVFDEMSDRNVVAWSAMIGGYARVGKVNEALELFREMQKDGVMPDEMAMVGAISACAVSGGALESGEWLHAFIYKNEMKKDLEVSTALVNMYAKCGCIDKAKQVFDSMPVKDAKAWSSMIVGYSIHGLVKQALETFREMEEAEVEPNHVSFIGVLSACAHGGLVADGKKYWFSMLQNKMEPSLEHYGCMVDMFCRANLVEEACDFVNSMPFSPNPAIWRTLLVSCKRNKLLQRGEIVAKQLIQMEPLNAENYILLSSLYGSVSDWVKMSHVRKLMNDMGIKTVPGCSSIEIDGHVHEFVMGDWSHPDAMAIRKVLWEVMDRVQRSGHEPWIESVLHNVGDGEKRDVLWEHSERLAIGYGLLKTKAPVVIRIVKNLRICVDCHQVTKIISELYEREIIVRDRIRFHRFIDGICSCNDLW